VCRVLVLNLDSLNITTSSNEIFASLISKDSVNFRDIWDLAIFVLLNEQFLDCDWAASCGETKHEREVRCRIKLADPVSDAVDHVFGGSLGVISDDKPHGEGQSMDSWGDRAERLVRGQVVLGPCFWLFIQETGH
jgi:hypothetical protein